MALTAPQPLGEAHDLAVFDCGEPALNDWLQKRARASQATGSARAFVVAENAIVVGYYALASGSVRTELSPGAFRRNMPQPIPVVLLARLAVDKRWQGRGVARGLMRDAALRISQAAESIGVRGVVVHAVSADAKAFYLALGFEPSPLEPMTLLIRLQDLRVLGC